LGIGDSGCWNGLKASAKSSISRTLRSFEEDALAEHSIETFLLTQQLAPLLFGKTASSFTFAAWLHYAGLETVLLDEMEDQASRPVLVSFITSASANRRWPPLCRVLIRGTASGRRQS